MDTGLLFSLTQPTFTEDQDNPNLVSLDEYGQLDIFSEDLDLAGMYDLQLQVIYNIENTA